MCGANRTFDVARSACALAALLALCAGCTKVTTSVGRFEHASEPGVLRLSDISDPSSLNPMFSGADIAYQLSAFTLEYLVQLDDHGNVIPVLAARVPSAENGDISKDGLTVTYHLRRGVKWSDGKPFGAQDVIASWRQVMNPRNNVIIREGYDAIARIDAPDPYTAVVHLRRPYASLVTRFFAGIQEGPIAVMPAHLIANQTDMNRSPFNAAPVGTGPFLLKSWERNGRMIFVANPNYWGGKPALQEIIFQAQPSSATELIGFQTHEIDADFDAGPGMLPEYRRLSGMHVVESRSLRLSVGVMNCQKPPFDNVHVRRAVAYAVDREAVLHNVIHGGGTLADEFVPNWSWAYAPGVPHYAYDPSRAAAELNAAGYTRGPTGVRSKGGQPLSIVLIGTAGDQAGAKLDAMVQQYLSAVGFSVTIKDYPYDLIFDNDGPFRTANYNLGFYSYSVNYDPSSLNDFGCKEIAPAGGNDARFCNPLTDQLEEEALATTDRARRKALYAQIQRQRMADLPMLPMYFRDRVGVVSDALTRYTPSSGIIPQWNAAQWSMP
jgi:peptide/nickel transport system substrate-binding protein